jgi:hypothetical protein
MPLHITYIQGGLKEFSETGVYPRRLTVHDVDVNKTWRRKITEKNCKGDFKMGNIIMYSYHIDIEDDIVTIFDSKGKRVEDFTMDHIMCD